MKRVWLLVALALAILELLAIAVTRRDFLSPNARVFPDMADGPAYASQGENPVLPFGRTLQSPPAGTVARGFTPFPYANTQEDRSRAGRELANPFPPTLASLERGKSVFRAYCLHCHGATGQGDGGVARRFPAFSMAIAGVGTAALPDGEIFHILTYGRNNMPGHASQISQADRWKVVLFLRDLQGVGYDREAADLAARGDPRPFSLVSADYGREVFDENCSSCHGKEGKSPDRGVPTLNNPRVLVVADDEYYFSIISHGRQGTQMPAWGEKLTPTQIQSLVSYFRSWMEDERDSGRVAASRGVVAVGRSLFRGNCAPCHGGRGQGGIGNSLSSPSFLAMANESFLRETIAQGRSHTAMPAGYAFDAKEVSDILAYIGSWREPRSTLSGVRASLSGAAPEIGKKFYQARCASCHGKKGEGGIGARLSGDDWLSMADDEFLYRAIVEGRPGTAMPAWHSLESADIADTIAYLRTWQRSPPRNLSHERRRGRQEFGELLYRGACRACHGDSGEGGLGNQIANPVFLSSVSDEFLWRTIAYGKEGTAMRGFLKDTPGGALMPLSSEDIDHVVAYLRRLAETPSGRSLKRPIFGKSLALGREIYEGKGGCAKCHGAEGEGAIGPSLAGPEFLGVASDGYLAGTIILGRENTEMRSFHRGGSVSLSREEVESVVAYVRGFEGREAKAHRQVPRNETVVAEGRELYERYCSSCHGGEGRGAQKNQKVVGYAPSLNNPDFLAAADDGFLLATIALGRPGTPMRPFAKGAGGIADLSTEEIQQIVAYVRSWEEEK